MNSSHRAFEDVSASPLSWPSWEKRSPHPKPANFASHSLAKASAQVLYELKRARARDVIISTDLALRLDGFPRSGQKQPDDKGVAVYFRIQDAPSALACDRWDRIEHNVWAIAKHVESLRGQERWGVGSMAQAFAGYAALPEHVEEAPLDWVEELGLEKVPESFTAAKIAFRSQCLGRHPDQGHDADDFARLRSALEAAAAHFGVDNKGRPFGLQLGRGHA